MKKLLFILLIIFSSCDIHVCEKTSIVTSTYRSNKDGYKYIVRVTEVDNENNFYYLNTNIAFVVGDTVKYSR